MQGFVPFSQGFLMVLIPVGLLVLISLAHSKRKKRNREREDLAKAEQIVAGKTIYVAVLKPDRKQTSVRNLIVEALLEAGVNVKFLKGDQRKQYKDEDIAEMIGDDMLLAGVHVDKKGAGSFIAITIVKSSQQAFAADRLNWDRGKYETHKVILAMARAIERQANQAAA